MLEAGIYDDARREELYELARVAYADPEDRGRDPFPGLRPAYHLLAKGLYPAHEAVPG